MSRDYAQEHRFRKSIMDDLSGVILRHLLP